MVNRLLNCILIITLVFAAYGLGYTRGYIARKPVLTKVIYNCSKKNVDFLEDVDITYYSTKLGAEQNKLLTLRKNDNISDVVVNSYEGQSVVTVFLDNNYGCR